MYERDLCIWKETYMYGKYPIYMKEIYVYEKIPVHIAITRNEITSLREIDIWKETYIYEKYPLYMKRDLCIWKRDLYISR